MIDATANPWRSWKGLLALLSLLLCGLLWINGLLGSLQRPSVGNALLLRQQELAALAEPALPASLRPLLLGGDPRHQLAQELARQAAASDAPLPDQQLYTWGLLEQAAGQGATARQILSGLPDLDNGWRSATPLQRQLLCEQERGVGPCVDQRLARRSLLKLLSLTALPPVLMLLGIGLLIRQLWLLSRRRLPEPAAMLAPPLSLVDVVLLIAGGFVVLGELITPLLLAPLLQQLLAPLGPSRPALQQALSVFGLYLSLMLGPLLILRGLLKGHGVAPAGGWLQWRWSPLHAVVRRALTTLLMVLPLVALVGWLLDHLWTDPGGSNPLLEMVLTSSSRSALLVLASTALVLAPLFEETLFRGVLLPVLATRWGGGWAVLISAASFALAHLSLGELLPLFVLGLGLGWLRLQSGRLGACVLMHGLWNGLTFANLLLLAG